MTRALLGFELRALLRDRSFVVLIGLLALITVIATASGMAGQRRQLATLAKAQSEATAELTHLRSDGRAILAGKIEKPRYWNDPTDVRGLAYYLLIVYATKPPLPLTALTVGQGDLLPFFVRISAGDNRGLASSYEPENPRALLIGRLDATFVLIFLLPLALAAAAHNVLAQELESGRMALLAAHGVSPRRIALLRLSLRSAVLGAVMAVAILVTLAAGRFDFASGGGALLLWFAVAGSYLSLWTALAAMVVAWTRRADGAALGLGILWVVVAVIGPWAIGSIAASAYPLPSRAEHILTMRAAADEAEARRARLLGRYLVDHPEFVTADSKIDAKDNVVAELASREYIEARLAAADAQFDQRLAERDRLVGRLRWISPPILVQQTMTDLAGAGRGRHLAFLGQAHAAIGRLRAYFSPIVLSRDRTIRDWDSWPRYEWREPSSAPARAAAWAAVGALLILALIAGAASWMRLGGAAPREKG